MSAAANAHPATAAPRPRVRHGVLAAALLLVAGLRLADGDPLWAGVLAAGGLTEAGLAVAARRSAPPGGVRAGRAAGASAVPTQQAAVDAGVVARSLAAHRRSRHLWWLSLGTCTVVALSLLPSAPALAGVLGVLALVSLQRARRARRSIGNLQRISDSDNLRARRET